MTTIGDLLAIFATCDIAKRRELDGKRHVHKLRNVWTPRRPQHTECGANGTTTDQWHLVTCPNCLEEAQ